MGTVPKREIPGIGFDVPHPERRKARQSGGGAVQSGGVKAGVPDIFFPKAKWIETKRTDGGFDNRFYCGLFVEMKRISGRHSKRRARPLA